MSPESKTAFLVLYYYIANADEQEKKFRVKCTMIVGNMKFNGGNVVREKKWLDWRSSGKTPLVIQSIWGPHQADYDQAFVCFYPQTVTFSGHTMTVQDYGGGTARFKRFDGTRDKNQLNIEKDFD